jgi:hypothetical protein
VAALLLSAAAASILSACGSDPDQETDDLQALYDAAVEDAKAMTAPEISRDLTAIVPDNPALHWENGVAGSRVLVATWIGSASACASYNDPAAPGCKAGQECPTYGFNSWVTVVPELKALLGGSPTNLRVAQALGLPPPMETQTLENTCVLEFYVSPGDLFRPSPDPEVTDREAELAFPIDGFRRFADARLVYSEMPCEPARCPSCTTSGRCGMTSYRHWFENRRAYVYSQTPVSGPYPWTALGYTYDWGNPVAPHFGVSEFVVNAGSSGVPVFIKSVSSTISYFHD